MNFLTVIEDDNYAPEEVPTHKEKGKSSAQRKKLVDISNLKDQAKQMNREETHQQHNVLFSTKEYAEKLQKENMTLMKALAHRNKIIELSGVEFQKLRINLRNVQEKNLQLAQANSQMSAELNTNRDRLKVLQHELGCQNVLLKARKMQLEEQKLPCTNHASKDKVPANAFHGDCKSFQAHDMNHRHTNRKRTPRTKPSESSTKPIRVNEKSNSKRGVSGVIDTTVILEETCRAEDDIQKGVVSLGKNQVVDNVINKYVTDAANSVKGSVLSKRFEVQETERTEKLLKMDNANETSRLSLRRRSARLRPEEAETCKSSHEREKVGETIKRRRVSSRQQSERFDFHDPEVTETLIADDAGRLVSEETVGSRSEAVVLEPSESKQDIKETKGKHRVSTRRQSTKGKSQTADETIPSSVYEEEHEKESKNKQTQEMMRRTSVGRPSRHAAEKVQSYREVSLKVKMRRSG